jgi:hypothetical protein
MRAAGLILIFISGRAAPVMPVPGFASAPAGLADHT